VKIILLLISNAHFPSHYIKKIFSNHFLSHFGWRLARKVRLAEAVFGILNPHLILFFGPEEWFDNKGGRARGAQVDWGRSKGPHLRHLCPPSLPLFLPFSSPFNWVKGIHGQLVETQPNVTSAVEHYEKSKNKNFWVEKKCGEFVLTMERSSPKLILDTKVFPIHSKVSQSQSPPTSNSGVDNDQRHQVGYVLALHHIIHVGVPYLHPIWLHVSGSHNLLWTIGVDFLQTLGEVNFRLFPFRN